MDRPLTDAEWHASLRRDAGTARRRVWKLGRVALGEGLSKVGSSSTLRMSLPDDLAQSFLGIVEAARRRLVIRKRKLIRPELISDANQGLVIQMDGYDPVARRMDDVRVAMFELDKDNPRVFIRDPWSRPAPPCGP